MERRPGHISGGTERRNQEWEHPLHKFVMPEGIRDWDVVQSLGKMWKITAGPYYSFAWRDPLDFWDFYDVTNDQSVSADLSDTLLILQHFGHEYNGGAYQDEIDNLLDRYVPNSAEGWRTAEANDGIDLIDALANLGSFGDSCAGPP